MAQVSTSKTYVGMMKNPSGKPFQTILQMHVGQTAIPKMPYECQHIQTQPFHGYLRIGKSRYVYPSYQDPPYPRM